MRKKMMWSIASLSLVFTAFASTPHAQGEVTRTVLLRHEASAPGYEVVMIEVQIPAGAREGRHTHPGTLLGRVEQGTLTFDYEGKQTTYKTGESFFADADKVHEGINKGDTGVKVLATMIVKAGGGPLTTPAK